MTIEQLLNKLIEKGWKPRGKTGIDERDGFVYMNKGQCIRLHKGIQANNMLCGEYNLRELVSKESGLWQFVCENKLFPKNRGHKRENDLGCGVKFYEDEPEYYIIECALLEEGEIEDFLIKNIKLGD